MKLKTKMGLAVFATVTSVLAIGLPAAAAPPGTIVEKGNLCILNEAGDLGYCVNLPNADTQNGTILQNWTRNQQGEPNNDWTEFKIGTVTMANGGFPWPNTLIAPGTGQPYDQIYSGEWVVMIAWSPYNTPSNYCMAENVSNQDGSGYAVGWTCQTTAYDQLWVPSGQGQYTNVRGTWDAANNGNGGEMDLEGEFTDGGTIGIETGVPSTNEEVYEYQNYHWYNRYGT